MLSRSIVEVDLGTTCLLKMDGYNNFNRILEQRADFIFWSVFLFLLKILSCWSDSNLEMRYIICWCWTPNIMDAERMDTSYWIMPVNY